VKFAKRCLNKLLVSICDFPGNWLREDRTFLVGINGLNMCTVKLHDVLKVKTPSIISVVGCEG